MIIEGSLRKNIFAPTVPLRKRSRSDSDAPQAAYPLRYAVNRRPPIVFVTCHDGLAALKVLDIAVTGCLVDSSRGPCRGAGRCHLREGNRAVCHA